MGGVGGASTTIEAAGHGDDEQGPLFRLIRNNRTGRIDKALVPEGRHRGAVGHVEKTRGLPPPEPARPPHSRSWGGSNARCSCSTGSKARNCADAAMPSSTRASSVISSRRSSAPSNKAGKQGRIADRSAEAQQFRASGLNLVIATIVFWNSTYIADAIAHLRATEQSVPDAWLAHTSPLSWAHISFSGDFLWERAAATADKRRPLNLGQTRVAA